MLTSAEADIAPAVSSPAAIARVDAPASTDLVDRRMMLLRCGGAEVGGKDPPRREATSCRRPGRFGCSPSRPGSLVLRGGAGRAGRAVLQAVQQEVGLTPQSTYTAVPPPASMAAWPSLLAT
ncbi:hypothetical protein GCM10028814_19450 [Angustibacter aerolatus]